MSRKWGRLGALVSLASGCLTLTACHPPPDVTVTPSTTRPVAGQSMSFHVDVSHQQADSYTWMDWDWDGDGTFETKNVAFTGRTTHHSEATVFRSFPAPGPIRPSVVVFERDDYGALSTFLDTSGATRTVPVEVQPVPPTTQPTAPAANRAPTAYFEATPNPAEVEREVTFDGSGSSDSDGTVVRHEWDLDANGTFERNTGTNPRTSYVYQSSGTYRVGLRVTDDDNASALFYRDVVVQAHLSQQAQAALDGTGFGAALPQFSVALRAGRAREGTTRINNDVVSITGEITRGRTRFLGAGPLPRSVARYALAHDFTAPLSLETVEMRGVLLVRFAPGRTACFEIVVAGDPHERVGASLRVLGGSGALTRLRGAGAVERIPQTRGKLTLPGRGRFALGRDARRLPRACRELNRQLRG